MLASDVGEQNLQQPVEDRVVGDVVGVEAELNQDFCHTEVVGRRVENPIQYGRQVHIGKFHRILQTRRRRRTVRSVESSFRPPGINPILHPACVNNNYSAKK
jgi:hypothetical protein